MISTSRTCTRVLGVFCFFLHFGLLLGQENEREIVVILPFETRGLSSDEKTELRHRFAEAFGESMRFDVLSVSAYTSALERSGLKNIDSCNTRPCLGQLGVMLGVPKVVHVSVDRWRERFIVHTRLVRSSDSALLYDERADHTGEYATLLSTVIPEQGRKLSTARLDSGTNWYFVAAAVLAGVVMIYMIYNSFARSSDTDATISGPSTQQ